MGKEQIIYEIQGSVPEPYIVKVSFEPLTISCTCTAAINGLVCRHRTGILSGENPGIIKGDISLLSKIKKTAESTDIFENLGKYENTKNERKKVLKKVESVFKNYREARENLALNKVKTDRAVIKCREALESAIDESIEAEKAVLKDIEVLQTVFIRPF
jgi:hypothetical protein